MKFLTKGIVAASIISSYAAQVNAQITTGQLDGRQNTITTAVPFLMISPDARAGAMGDAGVATPGDFNSIHWNAAKLAFLEKREVFLFRIHPGCANWFRMFRFPIFRFMEKSMSDQP